MGTRPGSGIGREETAWYRLALACLALLLCTATAADHARLPALSTAQPRTSLTEHLHTTRIDAGLPVDPQALWEAAAQPTEPPGPRWAIGAGERWVGRLSIEGGRKQEAFIVEVPVPSIDEVRVWHRTRGGNWHGAMAGDRVPLSRWPFANQFPAFPVFAGEEPVDLIVEVTNAAYMRVSVSLLTDRAFRENNVRRANLSGVVMGLGGMFALVCVAAAFAARRRAHVLLAVVAVWTFLAVCVNNGYMAVWLTPELPGFNDGGKHFTGMVLAGLMVVLVAQVLDAQSLRRSEKLAAWMVPVGALAYATAQQAVFPERWRLAGAAAVAIASMLACIALCLLSRWRRGRHTAWVAAAIGCLAVTMVLPALPGDPIAGLDLRAFAVATTAYAALMLLRQALLLQERYGRDVLSRAAISGNRDPLTALWSYQGFQQRYAEAALREAAGQGAASVMVFLLPGLERSRAEHGMVLTERSLVRFAAALQRLLGHRWAIGRLSKTRFAAISLRTIAAAELVHTATQALSECTRMAQPLDLVSEFDLRIACCHSGVATQPLVDLLRQLEEAGRALEAGKRITLI